MEKNWGSDNLLDLAPLSIIILLTLSIPHLIDMHTKTSATTSTTRKLRLEKGKVNNYVGVVINYRNRRGFSGGVGAEAKSYREQVREEIESDKN